MNILLLHKFSLIKSNNKNSSKNTMNSEKARDLET